MLLRSLSTPVIAAALLGAVIALALLSQPAPCNRQTKAEKRVCFWSKEARRLGRKRGRAATSKRTRSKRKETKERLVKEIGIDEFKKIVQSDKQEKEEQRKRLQAAMDDPDSLRLVVDLNWAESASGKELSSLVKQLCYVYGRAKASLVPPRLMLTSYEGRAAAALKSAGAESWLVDRSPLDVFTVFDQADIVYLSPDADEALDEVRETNVYVVGGIVDRNLNKGLTLKAAEAGRARAVRLPFDEYLPDVPRGDRVLTVCACVGVLMGVRAGQEWREALEKSVPRRGVDKAARRARGGAWRGAVLDGVGSGWGVVGCAARDNDQISEHRGVANGGRNNTSSCGRDGGTVDVEAVTKAGASNGPKDQRGRPSI